MILESQIARTAPMPNRFQPQARPRLQRKCVCGGTPGPFGECEACSKTRLQRKLSIGASNDPLEQEANRVADQVMAMTGHSVVSAAAPRIQRLTRQPIGQLDAAPASVDRVLAGSGRPLEPSLRQDMEQRFGHDFSTVRTHTSAAAEQSAHDVNALAYTVGHHVVFAPGNFSPDTHGGRRLIAHELTHAVQQRGSSQLLQREIDQAALDQCIAELGGSTAYRDGGLASPEELERYRQVCMTRQASNRDSDSSRAIQNLRRAWGYARERLRPEVAHEVENLFSTASLIAMAAFALAYLASQLTPIGWVADAFALVVLTGTVIFVGMLAINIARDLYRFFSCVTATSDRELRTAGRALARALARGGVGIFIALLTRGMRGGTRPTPPTATASATVEVVAAGFGRVRVPAAATAGEAVQASGLQELVSYAVMVPPPGGASPSSPSASSGGGRRVGSGEGGGRGTNTEVGPGPGIRLTKINYGGDVLSQLAQRMRVTLGLRRGGNVAVFEFDNIPPRFRTLVRRLGGRNAHFEGNRMAVQNVNGSAHSEQLAHMLITEGRRRGIQLNVRNIYTEYNPCTDTCLPLIRRQYPNANVTFSFIWELWGRQAPDRNAAVDALFTQPGRGRRGNQ